MRAAVLFLAVGLSIPGWAAEPVVVAHIPDEAPAEDPDDPEAVQWSVLACTKSACTLEPASAYYKDKRRDKEKYGVALVSGLPGRASVPVYYNPLRDRSYAGEAYGSFGLVLDVPDQPEWRIVPRLSRDATVAAATVYLEHGTRRQPVTAIPLDWLEADLSVEEMVSWAGDIDGDGKPDLLLAQPPLDHQGEQVRAPGIHLWLSGSAGAGLLVAHAASVPELDAGEEQ